MNALSAHILIITITSLSPHLTSPGKFRKFKEDKWKQCEGLKRLKTIFYRIAKGPTGEAMMCWRIAMQDEKAADAYADLDAKACEMMKHSGMKQLMAIMARMLKGVMYEIVVGWRQAMKAYNQESAEVGRS